MSVWTGYVWRCRVEGDACTWHAEREAAEATASRHASAGRIATVVRWRLAVVAADDLVSFLSLPPEQWPAPAPRRSPVVERRPWVRYEPAAGGVQVVDLRR